MQKDVTLENQSDLKEFKEYNRDKLAIAKVCVLSTAPNSHGLIITEEVLRRDIKSIQGQFLVAHMMFGDAHSHDKEEVPVGYFVTDREIEFEEVEQNGTKIVKAWALAVLSKQYAKEAYDMFVQDNHRATSIEMKVTTSPEDENLVLSFDAYGSTILGKPIRPSCKEAEISLIRFADKANKFFARKADSLVELKSFAKERQETMAEEYANHPINTSKEAVYPGDWDGNKAKQDLVKEKNFKSLAPKVCLRLEEGWEDREVTKLGYPVMGLYDGEWRYSTKALASAQAYAEQHNETEVLNKIKAIKKKLDLNDSEGKEEDAKMEQFEEAKMEETAAEVEEMEEKKSDEEGEAEAEAKEEMAEPTAMEESSPEPEEEAEDEEHEHGDDCDCSECRMSKMADKIAQLEKEAEDKDNIIMDKDAELAELRQFKAGIEEKEKAMAVEAVMAEVADFLEKDMAESLRSEGMSCGKEDIDAWANKCKAMCFSAVKKAPEKKKDNLGVFSFAAPIENQKTEDGDIWSRLKKNYK